MQLSSPSGVYLQPPLLGPKCDLNKNPTTLLPSLPYLKLLHDSLPPTTWPSRPYVPWPQLNFHLYVFY